MSFRRWIRLAWLCSVGGMLGGCGEAPQASAPLPPSVEVAEAVGREVTDFDEFTGRFEAIERVELRPRVSGYIDRVHFMQGKEVKAGDLLFAIDARPYEAVLEQARAELARGRSRLALARSELVRAEKLLDARAISREEYDQRVSGLREAEAVASGAEAAVKSAALDLEFTQVRAPIEGMVGRAEVTAGNLVAAGQTLLTTVVCVDPLYVEFDVDESAFLRYGDLARRGERRSSRDVANPIYVGVGDEAGHPHEGKMVFVDNAINPATGTIVGRGQVPNPDRRFAPGLFARIKLVGSGKYAAVLVRDSAVGTDQNLKYVLVVGEDGVTQYRRVQLGPMIEGLRVVRQGLRPGERIVVSGLQRVRPGQPVTAQAVPMRVDASAASG